MDFRKWREAIVLRGKGSRKGNNSDVYCNEKYQPFLYMIQHAINNEIVTFQQQITALNCIRQKLLKIQGENELIYNLLEQKLHQVSFCSALKLVLTSLAYSTHLINAFKHLHYTNLQTIIMRVEPRLFCSPDYSILSNGQYIIGSQ